LNPFGGFERPDSQTRATAFENFIGSPRICGKLRTDGSSATEARTKLYRLIDQTTQSHEPIVITGKRGNAVLVSEDDWRSIQETIYLLNIPGMRESIREGLATPIEIVPRKSIGRLENRFYEAGSKRRKKVVGIRT
jgi:antitoxin YefM